MRKKIVIFTVFYLMMAFEFFFRLVDWITWIYVPDGRSEYNLFSSHFDVSYSDRFRQVFLPRVQGAPYTLIQTCLCAFMMSLNTFMWLRNKKYSHLRHITHYYIASALLILFQPWPSIKCTTTVKYGFLCIAIFLYALCFATAICPTGLHQCITTVVTMCYVIRNFKVFFKVRYTPICYWDSYFHIIVPITLMLLLGYFKMVEQLRKEQALQKKCKDLNNIVGNLSQGLALTEHTHSRNYRFTAASLIMVNNAIFEMFG